jgi:DNA helicase HerA-like ATPase
MPTDKVLGHVVTVTGAQITVAFGAGGAQQWIRIGDMIKVSNADHAVVGTIAEVRFSDEASASARVFIVDLLGEIVARKNGDRHFTRGVSLHPVPGDSVYAADDDDLDAIYDEPSPSSITVGSLHHDASRPACLLIDELLTKHFAVLGTTGSGKSCAITLILKAVLHQHPSAHIVLFDPHNEYSAAFGSQAEVISVDNLELPIWLFNLEELVNVLVRGGTNQEQESQATILKDAVIWARRHFAGDDYGLSSITADTPVPFRVHELLRYINEEMGRVTKADTSFPYLRLRTRIESLRGDRRYSFLFSSEEDSLTQIIARLLRMPVNDKPMSIVDLSGVPSEIADVLVSVLCRAVFDFSMWSRRDRMPPILLVCEEAHRYVPADPRVGFEETSRVITRVAKEGRKYGVSLALISQRPSELSAPALAQCGTVFALRLGSDADQQFIARTVPDVARGMLGALPSLPSRQAIISGEGVRVPMRIQFADLPDDERPQSASASFSEAWQSDGADQWFIEDGVQRWRAQVKEDARVAR